MRMAFDLNQAHTATTDGFQSGVMAECGNVDADRFGRVEYGNAFGEFVRLAVDSCAKHFQFIL